MKTIMRYFAILTAGAIVAGACAQDNQQQNPPARPPAAAATPTTSNGDTNRALRLNFRGVPLDMVLNYLSEAAGFIIVLETDVKGKVDVWSNQPLTREEAVELLNTVLNRNGYAAIRNGRTLRVVSRDEAKTKDIPVRSGNRPDEIPKSDAMVTQIIPVQHANATQLTQNLQALLPTYAILSANESGNALVLTGTQADARRIAEIVQALDTSISSVSTLKVFPLRYADAKELATAIKELFQPPTQQGADRRTQFFNRFGPGGFGGDGGGRGDRDRSSTGASGNPAASRVIAVADERSNSLVVSAPDELIPEIEQMIKEIDVSVADATELRVFHLRHADPLEMADIFTDLFPDESTTSNNNQGEFRFRGPPGFFGGGRSDNQQGSTSQRMKKKGRVIAVPDQRTSSLIVSAASELMPQIEQMVAQLDASPAKKQKVFVYSLENADVQQVEQIVRDMFERNNTTANRNNANQNSALQNRTQQQQQNQTPGQGTQGFGNQGGFGGGQNQTFR